MNNLKFALPVVALLSACNPGTAVEPESHSSAPATAQAPAVPAPAAESVPASAETPVVAQSASENVPATPVPATQEKAVPAPISGEGFAVTKVVPEDFTSAAFNIFTDGAMRFRVEFYATDVFRIQAAPDGNFADPLNDPTAAQILVDDLPVNRDRVDCEVTDADVVWRTGTLELRMNRAHGTFSLSRADGTPIFSEKKPLSFAGNTTTQTLSTDPDEFYYGGGQQNGHFSHKGTKIEISANGWNEGDRPNPAPFYMSNRGYGVLRHTFATGAYDFTGTDAVSTVHNENRFDAFYFVGDGFPRIIDLYTRFTGRPNFLPIWGFELGDADAYMTRDPKTKEPLLENGKFKELTPYSLERVAEKYREHDMPCGWMLVNDGYGCNYVQLPHVVQSLAGMGFQTGLWTEGALTRMAWEVGVAGTRVQKLDVAWTSDVKKTTREKPLSKVQHALECNKIAWDGIAKNSDSRPLTWTVLGWAGTQRYAVCWTGDQAGDWNLIRYHIPTLITSGMSGQAYATTDVDGIFGGSPETYTRDLQWKCFTPALYVMNGWSDADAMAGVPKKSPWWFEEPYRSINRSYLKRKLRMTPYMYKYAHDAATTGAPIVRGMIWNFPEDRKTWDKSTQYQFMLGEDILVAPVYTAMTINKGWRKEDIYLPEGVWFDYWDGRVVPGPYTIDNYPITLEKLPIFVRGGAIIPMYPEMLYSTQKPKDVITFDVYPYGKSSFEMYEDDGNTRAYLDGKYSKQLITCDAPKGTAGDITIDVAPALGEFDGKYAERAYAFEIHTPFRPTRVLADGAELREIADAKAYENSAQGWRFDPNDRRGIVFVKLAKRSTSVPAKIALDVSEKLGAWAAFEPYPEPVVSPELDKSEFKVVASSEQGDGRISNAFDGSAGTIWHSNYSREDEKHPYTIDIDLGKLTAVNGFGYLPRAGLSNGAIKDYEIYVARTPGDFGEPVAKGAFPPEKEADGSPKYQKVAFPAKWGRHVRLVVLSALNGERFGSAAEFDVLQDIAAEPLADESLNLGDRIGIVPAKIEGDAVFNKGRNASEIVVDGEKIATGISVLAGTKVSYALDGSWDRLEGAVGREKGGKGPVTFRIFADGKQIFERAGMSPESVKQLVSLDIAGVKQLVFEFVADADGDASDSGVWTDIRLVRKGSE